MITWSISPWPTSKCTYYSIPCLAVDVEINAGIQYVRTLLLDHTRGFIQLQAHFL